MSQDTQKDQKEQSPVASLFQKTHAKMMTLSRIEEQFTALAAQRAKLQEELRSLQGEINAELDRAVEGSTTLTEQGSMKIKAAA